MMITVTVEEKSVEAQILGQLQQLDGSQKQQVLDYVQVLTDKKTGRPEGMSGEEFFALVASLDFSSQDLAEIRQAIEEDHNVIDPDEVPNADDW